MQTIDANISEYLLNATPDKVLSLQQASAYLGVSQAAIRAWKRNGKAPAFFRAGKLLRFRKVDLDRWIESRLVAAKLTQ